MNWLYTHNPRPIAVSVRSSVRLQPVAEMCGGQLRPARSSQRGFSLLEAVVALAILSFITLAAWYAFDGIARMKETVENTSESFALARTSLGRMSRELQMAYLTQNPNKNPEPRFLTVFRAKDEKPVDSLHFATFSHQRLYRESLESDTTEISYFAEPDDDAPGLYKLLHREAARIDGLPEEGGVVEVMARRVQSFQLRFYDAAKQEWAEEWDTEKIEHLQQLPRAVEISMVLIDLEGAEHPYSTVVLIPLVGTKGALG